MANGNVVPGLVINPSATATGAAFTVGGTSTTTGGVSIMTGALGAATEHLAVYPADGVSAATRVGALSVRLSSAGFLSGSQVFGVSSAGVASLATSTGTLPATISNDGSGNIQLQSNGGKNMVWSTTGLFLNPGLPLTLQGATSGTISITPPSTGSGALTLPAATGTIALGILSKQIFTTSGTFTIPAGVTAVKVTLTGGGGAGAGGSGASASNGSGGGAGGTAIKWLSGLTPGNTLTVTVGSGGTGVSNAPGNNGTASTVASGTQTITTLTGGSGFGAPNAVQPGSPGGATNGDLNLPGGIGTGQGGGSTTVGGNGAASYWGGGGTFGVGAAGGAGINPGAGGGGAGGGGGSAVTGGAGAAGIVIFEWVK